MFNWMTDSSLFQGIAPLGLLLFVWEIYWKGRGLWFSAQRKEKWWFIAFLVVNTLGVLDFLLEKCGNIILVRGNHDTILGPIANKRDIAVKDYELVNDILVCHGDKIPKKEALAKAKTIMIGHEHPAVSLREGSRAEKFKCFLKGKWNGKGIIVMPSFNMAVEGSDVLKEELLSPFLSDISGFEVLVAGGNGETLDFGTVKKLQAL